MLQLPPLFVCALAIDRHFSFALSPSTVAIWDGVLPFRHPVVCRLHNVRCFSMASTIEIGFLVYAGTCVVFIFGSFLLVIYLARLLLLFLLGLLFLLFLIKLLTT